MKCVGSCEPIVRCCWRTAPFCVLAFALVLLPTRLGAELLPVRQAEGLTHGFLALRSTGGEALASGEYAATSRGDRVTLRLTFRFRDGSIDDEKTVFTQRGHFHLVSDWHQQRGPRFQHPYTISIEEATGRVTVRTDDGSKQKDEVYHLDLPDDLANGMLLTLIKNLAPGATEATVSMLVLTPKPRVVKLMISPDGEDPYRAGGARYRSLRYAVKVDLGGVMGIVAPVLGKEPRVDHVWVTKGAAPAILRMEAQFYPEGPMWDAELASPVWK